MASLAMVPRSIRSVYGERPSTTITILALMIRTVFRSMLYYKYVKESTATGPPKGAWSLGFRVWGSRQGRGLEGLGEGRGGERGGESNNDYR